MFFLKNLIFYNSYFSILKNPGLKSGATVESFLRNLYGFVYFVAFPSNTIRSDILDANIAGFFTGDPSDINA